MSVSYGAEHFKFSYINPINFVRNRNALCTFAMKIKIYVLMYNLFDTNRARAETRLVRLESRVLNFVHLAYTIRIEPNSAPQGLTLGSSLSLSRYTSRSRFDWKCKQSAANCHVHACARGQSALDRVDRRAVNGPRRPRRANRERYRGVLRVRDVSHIRRDIRRRDVPIPALIASSIYIARVHFPGYEM